MIKFLIHSLGFVVSVLRYWFANGVSGFDIRNSAVKRLTLDDTPFADLHRATIRNFFQIMIFQAIFKAKHLLYRLNTFILNYKVI